MIFYFSATGNSKYATERLAAATDDRAVFLRDAIRSRSFRYEVSRGERVGFVFPVYFGGLPSIMQFFLKKLELSGYQDNYVYTVMTCGQLTSAAANQLAALLKAKGLPLSARFSVVMPDNYIPAFTVPGGEEIDRILDAADETLDGICRVVQIKGEGDYDRCGGPVPGLQTAVAYSAYAHGRSTKPFVVTEQCIGCGLCQEICPCGAILISGGKPAWVKAKCVRCLGCLHRCPAQAIHWKTPEENRGRYYNPRVDS